MNQMPVDRAVAQLLLRYAKLIVARGDVPNNLNRDILRLRPDAGAVIHVHHDETIPSWDATRRPAGFDQLAYQGRGR